MYIMQTDYRYSPQFKENDFTAFLIYNIFLNSFQKTPENPLLLCYDIVNIRSHILAGPLLFILLYALPLCE